MGNLPTTNNVVKPLEFSHGLSPINTDDSRKDRVSRIEREAWDIERLPDLSCFEPGRPIVATRSVFIRVRLRPTLPPVFIHGSRRSQVMRGVCPGSPDRRGFTLIELLVVIAIISV